MCHAALRRRPRGWREVQIRAFIDFIGPNSSETTYVLAPRRSDTINRAGFVCPPIGGGRVTAFHEEYGNVAERLSHCRSFGR